MPVETQSGVPCHVQSGDTVVFTIENPEYPPSAWSAQFFLNRNNTASTGVTATESGNTYTFTLSAAFTASLAPGTYTYFIRYTETATNAVYSEPRGQLTVLPNLAVNQTPSTAEAQLALCNARIDALLATGGELQSVSFNGQSFTRASIGSLFAIRDKLKAEVYRELRAKALMAGENDGTIYQARFRRC